MAGYKEVFPNKHAVLPVVHVEHEQQTLRNAETAYKEGADGVFLISMRGMDAHGVLQMQHLVRQEFSAWFVGVNYLDTSVVDTFSRVDAGVSGVWSDFSGIDETVTEQIIPEMVNGARLKSGWRGLYFGGVAFKYQKEVNNLELAAKIAAKYMDVVTTSGSGTGTAPDVTKISRMKAAIGSHPLGIASGITPDNVLIYLDIADCFLVATSLLVPGTEMFDSAKIRDLVQTVKG